jgi:hypothetical protein
MMGKRRAIESPNAAITTACLYSRNVRIDLATRECILGTASMCG